MKIFIAFKKDDPLNFKYFKIFWMWKHAKVFLKKNLEFSFKNEDFYLYNDDPLKKTIDNYKIMRRKIRYEREIH